MWIIIWNFSLFVALNIFKTILSWELAEVSNEKSAKFQTTIHIDYDREENKIELILDSQTKMISTLVQRTIARLSTARIEKIVCSRRSNSVDSPWDKALPTATH